MREFQLTRALHSTRSLIDVLNELTLEEVLHVLKVEAGSRRRAVVLDKLIQKAGELTRQNFIQSLKEKYSHGT
jgi:hypothetical protein